MKSYYLLCMEKYGNNKYQLLRVIKNLNYLIEHILYQIFKITSIASQNMKH